MGQRDVDEPHDRRRSARNHHMMSCQRARHSVCQFMSVHITDPRKSDVAESQVGRCGSKLQVQVHASRIEASTCGCGAPRGERGDSQAGKAGANR